MSFVTLYEFMIPAAFAVFMGALAWASLPKREPRNSRKPRG